MKLIGKKIILNTISHKNLEELRRIRFKTNVVKFFHGKRYQTKKGQIHWYKNIKKCKSHIYLTSYEKKSKRIIGLLNAKISIINKNAQVGWYFDIEKKQNNLYAESVIIFLDHLFNKFDLIKVYSDVLSFNQKAIKFNNNIGFVIEGETLQHYYYFKKYVNAKFVALYKHTFYKKNKKILKFLNS